MIITIVWNLFLQSRYIRASLLSEPQTPFSILQRYFETVATSTETGEDSIELVNDVQCSNENQSYFANPLVSSLKLRSNWDTKLLR